MDFNSRPKVEPYRPFYIRFFTWIFEVMPPPNTIKGIIAFSSLIYLVTVIIKLISIKFSKTDSGENEEEDPMKKAFNRKLEETRKIRSVEANKILDRINKIN